MKTVKGKFITFEGSEGSGKSTQINLLKEYLEEKGRSVLLIREPGGVVISEKIRKLLLDVKNNQMSDACEMLLYMAARAQLVEEIILPALKKGKVILCDRFLDSTVAYQGYGNGGDVALIKKLGKYVTQQTDPDLTFLFDIDIKKGFSRIQRTKDRIEQRGHTYHNKVRNGYLEIARKESRRVKVIAADQDKERIFELIKECVTKLIG